jgi:uncharacterized membrane-anchored protein YhcB (DUF1043 family)
MVVTLLLIFLVWRTSDGTTKKLQEELASLRTEMEQLQSELKSSRVEKA